MSLWLYVYGNGDFIFDILTSVNFFMSNGLGFFKVAAVVSLLFFAVEATGVLPTKGYDWIKFIRAYFIISVFVLTPYPGKIDVHDVLSNQDQVFDFSNSKLPVGLIVPIATVSTLMYELIGVYQQKFQIDSNLNYTYSGMNFGANFIQSLDNANSYDDKFNFNLDHYMQNCGFPLLYKAGATAELRTSQDIFATLATYTSDSRYVQQQDFGSGAAIVKSCSKAISDITNYYNNNQDKFMSANAQVMGIGTGDSFMHFMNAANASTSQLLGITQGASTALKQAIAMNMIMASLKDGAQSAGNGNLALAAYDAEQFQAYKKGSELSGSAAARTIPILVGIAFALLLFLYPVMIFMAIAMGSYKAIGIFMQIIVAINLIPLIYEIINYISTFYLQKKLGIIITGQGYNYDISTSLYSFTDNMIIAGNYLCTSAPILAYAIVTGSATALTSVFSHINDPAKNEAIKTGDQFSKGNMDMGNASIDNASFNNMQGNKFDDQLSMNSGVATMKYTTPGGMHTNIGGQNYDSNHKSDLLATPNFAQMASSSLQNSLSHSRDQMGSLSKQWGQQSQRLHDLSNNMQSGQDANLSSGSEEAKTLQHAQSLATSIQGTLGVSAMGSSASGQASSFVNDDLQRNLNEYQRYANVLSHSSNQAIRDAFSNTDSLTSNSSRTIQEAISTSQALNDVNTNQSTINTNFSNDFNNHLRDQGYDTTQMTASEQTAAAQQFVADKVNSTYGIKSNLNAPIRSMSGIDSLAHSTSSNVSSKGLSSPKSNDVLNKTSDALHKQVTDSTANYTENSGNLIGNQVIEQAKVGKNVVKNTVELGGKVMYDIAHPDEINDR